MIFESSSAAISESAENTQELGKAFARELPPNSIVTLHGDLGAGKTTFVRGIVEGLHAEGARGVSSPTFSLLNTYPGNTPLYHFDLYRLPHPSEFIAAGFDEYFAAGGICCIEWAEKIADLLPKHCIRVCLNYLGETKREILIEKRQ